MAYRAIEKRIPSQPTSDGAGVRLQRSIGSPALTNLDPFLLLDEFSSADSADYIAGFPDHPHRGFETVTYMLAGRMRHEDNAGNGGSLLPGGVQWMTAGRGIVHSEMPEQEEGLMRGFQLWVNLPATDKMIAPRYQNYEPDEIPEVETAEGATVRIIAGTVAGTTGPVNRVSVDPLYLDIMLPDGGTFEHEIPEGHTAFVYPFDGAVSVVDGAAQGDPPTVDAGTLIVLGDGDRVRLRGNGTARALLIAGRPIGEPIARYGPFVMNTRSEIEQAVTDFRAGRF